MSDKPSKAFEDSRDFEPVDDHGIINSFLKEGSKTHCSAMVWTQNQKHVIKTHLSLYNKHDKLLYCWIPKGFDAGQFMDDMARENLTECFFSLSLARANVFFKSRFLGYDKGGLKFEIPARLFKVQRRKDVRFRIPDHNPLHVAFEDPLFPDNTTQKRIADISAGGLAILVGEQEQMIYQAGMVLKRMVFRIGDRRIECEGEIRHVKVLPVDVRIPRSECVKLGVLFKGIRPGDSQHVAAYVFEEARKYYSRIL